MSVLFHTHTQPVSTRPVLHGRRGNSYFTHNIHHLNATQLEKCLGLAIASTLLANCDALHFGSNFDGLNLDHVGTIPFASLATPQNQVPSTNASLSLALSTTPTTNIFNYKALPSNVCERYNEHKNLNIILMCVNNMIPSVWPNYSVH
jgi:hypothetical protein